MEVRTCFVKPIISSKESKSDCKNFAQDAQEPPGDGVPEDQESPAHQATELNQLELFFREQDAVLEPNVPAVLSSYMRQHGKPAQAIELLSDNYVGELMVLFQCDDHIKKDMKPASSTVKLFIYVLY